MGRSQAKSPTEGSSLEQEAKSAVQAAALFQYASRGAHFASRKIDEATL